MITFYNGSETRTIKVDFSYGKDGAKGDKGDKGDNGENGIGVIAGGTAGQVLAKRSDADYDMVWADVEQSGGEAVQSDWNEANVLSMAYIKNKPTIPSKTSELSNDSDYTTNEYVNGQITATVGDINAILDSINGEVL